MRAVVLLLALMVAPLAHAQEPPDAWVDRTLQRWSSISGLLASQARSEASYREHLEDDASWLARIEADRQQSRSAIDEIREDIVAAGPAPPLEAILTPHGARLVAGAPEEQTAMLQRLETWNERRAEQRVALVGGRITAGLEERVRLHMEFREFSAVQLQMISLSRTDMAPDSAPDLWARMNEADVRVSIAAHDARLGLLLGEPERLRGAQALARAQAAELRTVAALLRDAMSAPSFDAQSLVPPDEHLFMPRWRPMLAQAPDVIAAFAQTVEAHAQAWGELSVESAAADGDGEIPSVREQLMEIVEAGPASP